jgi:hypothetical protein
MRRSVIKKGDRWYVKIELDVDPATALICCRSSIGASTSSRPTKPSPPSWPTGFGHLNRQSAHQRSSRTNATYGTMRSRTSARPASRRSTPVYSTASTPCCCRAVECHRHERGRATSQRSLRAKGLTLVATAEQLRGEFTSAEHITKDTLA